MNFFAAPTAVIAGLRVELLKVLEPKIMPAIPLGNRLHEFFKLLSLRRENLEAPFVAYDEMAEWPEDVIEAERMNSADVVVGVIAGLNVQPKPRFNLVNGSVGISNARDSAGGAAHVFDRTDQLGNYHARLAAAGAGSQHEIVIAADGASPIGRKLHDSISHFAESQRYLGMVSA